MKPTISATVLLIALLFVPSLAIFNTTTCSSTQYYDTTTMNCESCQTNASPDSTTSCKCNPGFYYSQSNLVGWRGTCTACPSSTPASSTDRKTCMACPTGSTPTTTTTTTGTSVECVCTSGIAYDVGIDGEVTTSSTSGTSVPTKVCLTCPTGTYQDPDGKGCIDCGLGMTTDSSGSCTCTTGYTAAGSSCVATSDATSSSIGTSNQVSAARTVTYTDVESTTGSVGRLTMTSGTIDYLYTESVVGCILYKDPTSCQVFANLCILLMGSVNTVICKLYQNTMSNFATVIGDDAGFIEDLPWIYYWNGPLTTIYDANIQLTVTLGKGSSTKVSLFDFFVAKYAINGTYLGTETLTNQLLACPNSVQAGDYLKTFGTPFISNCDLDLSLLETTDTIFYELFLVDTDGTNVDIPVKVYNLVTSTGATPNTGDLSSNTVFTRRFFIYDTVLGLASSSDYLNGATPAVIRFAKNVRLVFEVQTDDKSKINRPYLEIEYASKQVVDFTTNSTSYATFKSVFQMDISSFWTTVTILFIITNILAGLVAIFRTYVWARYNPARFNPESWPVLLFFRLILNLMKAWSEAMFFFLFIITAYWFIFYKMQNTVYFIVPDEDTNPNEFVAFRVVFGLTVSFNILSLLNMIREQVQMDFFIIDWEKPRLTYKRDLNREVYLQSAWRMILVANEFNELQTSRYYPIELLYMIYGFFMIGLKWEQFSAVIPSLTTTVGDGISRDIVLKFFLAVFLMFVIGMILYGLRKAITLKVPTSIQEFTDLCSIANISIFFFDKQFHGYYLHGMAPSGQSEGSISELKRYLDLESKGTVRSRGLLANDPTHLQTYEIFFPWEARQAYNNLYKAEITKEIYARQAAQQMSNQVQLKLVNKALPNDFDFQKLEGRRLVIQEHLKLYIEGVRVESGKLIRDKTPSMRFFGIPPVDIETLQGNPLFYKDDAYGFQNTVFYGNEFSMLISDILIYTMWDIIVQNTFIALFLSYFTNKFIAFLRQFFGERNISQKALIDDAFLI